MISLKLGVLSFKRSCRWILALAGFLIISAFILNPQRNISDEIITINSYSFEDKPPDIAEVFRLRSQNLQHQCDKIQEGEGQEDHEHRQVFVLDEPKVEICQDVLDTMSLEKFLGLMNFKPLANPDHIIELQNLPFYKVVMVIHPFKRVWHHYLKHTDEVERMPFKSYVEKVIHGEINIAPFHQMCSVCRKNPDLIVKLDRHHLTKEVSNILLTSLNTEEGGNDQYRPAG